MGLVVWKLFNQAETRNWVSGCCFVSELQPSCAHTRPIHAHRIGLVARWKSEQTCMFSRSIRMGKKDKIFFCAKAPRSDDVLGSGDILKVGITLRRQGQLRLCPPPPPPPPVKGPNVYEGGPVLVSMWWQTEENPSYRFLDHNAAW